MATATATITTFDPPTVPALTPDEVDAAVRGGGMVGLVRAYRARIMATPPATLGIDPTSQAARNALARLDSSPVVVAINTALSQFVRPGTSLTIDDALATVEAQALAAEVLDAAVNDIGHWVASRPARNP